MIRTRQCPILSAILPDVAADKALVTLTAPMMIPESDLEELEFLVEEGEDGRYI
jgi:hypothetical protein